MQILEADLRSQMLELSKSQSTFLEGPACSRAAAGAAGSSAGSAAACSPPAAVRNSALDYKQMLPTCMAALREDEQLRQRRFELVPARCGPVDVAHLVPSLLLPARSCPAFALRPLLTCWRWNREQPIGSSRLARFLFSVGRGEG